MPDTKEPVYFEVLLKDYSKADEVKSKLEGMTNNIHINISDLKLTKSIYVFGETSQEVYESVFNAKLDYLTRNVLSGGRYRNVGDWHETEKAKVPSSLEELVTEIRLSGTMTICGV